jgi:hypothetical protein
MKYRGTLKSVEEHSIQLQGLTGWIEIPIEKISSIKLEDEKDTMPSNKFIDKSFFDPSDGGDSP